MHTPTNGDKTIALKGAVTDLIGAGGIAHVLENGMQGYADILGQLFSLFSGDVIGYGHFHGLCLLDFGRHIFALKAQNSKSFMKRGCNKYK